MKCKLACLETACEKLYNWNWIFVLSWLTNWGFSHNHECTSFFIIVVPSYACKQNMFCTVTMGLGNCQHSVLFMSFISPRKLIGGERRRGMTYCRALLWELMWKLITLSNSEPARRHNPTVKPANQYSLDTSILVLLFLSDTKLRNACARNRLMIVLGFQCLHQMFANRSKFMT